jgi:hypothetical protein
MPAALGFVFGIKTELDERVLVLGGNQEDIAAPATVTAAGTAARNVLLAAKGQAAVAAIAGLDQNASFVDEQLGDFLDADEFALAATVAVLHHAGHLGEERVVLAPPDVIAGLDPRAPLADDDRSAGHQLSAEQLHAQPLRIGIAPVFGTA